MAHYKYQDSSQGLFLSINLKEQLLPGTFEWTLDYLIGRIDLSIFDKNYNNDEKGASAYPPEVLLKIIMYCYSRGIITSRPIEKAARENITVKALADNMEPDHDTIAHFISSNQEGIKRVFTQILLECGELGLIGGEMFAIDGCKLPSNASREWSGKIAELEKKKGDLEKLLGRIIDQNVQMDREESINKKKKRFEKSMGDDGERRRRHVERIERKIEKLKGFLEGAESRKGTSGNEVQSNITDNESARLKGSHGYIQGYNGIAIADSAHQIVISAEAFGTGHESEHLPYMLDNLKDTMQEVTEKENPLKYAICLGDTGFFSEKNLQEAKRKGIEVLIPDPQFRRRDPSLKTRKKERYTAEDFKYDKRTDEYICPNKKRLRYRGYYELNRNKGNLYQASTKDCANCPCLEKCIIKRGGKNPRRSIYIPVRKYGENLSEKMRKRIDEPENREIYSQRMQIIEPVFADIRHCKRMDRFSLRTKGKVTIQWMLYCIIHNIGKCIAPLVIEYEGI